MDKEVQKKKKRNIIIILVILVILFIGYGITIKSTPESREKKIISYLEKKYNSEFEIIEMTSSGENVIFAGVDCDGATFCPRITDKGVYYYKYDVLSIDNNIMFEVKYLDKRLKDEIEVIRYYSIDTDDMLDIINNYIISIMGTTNSEIGSTSISYEFDENFDKICNDEYKQKLEKISNYINEKNTANGDLDILVYFSYSNDILITLGYSKPILTQFSDEYFDGSEGINMSTGKYMKKYSSIDEYLNR